MSNDQMKSCAAREVPHVIGRLESVENIACHLDSIVSTLESRLEQVLRNDAEPSKGGGASLKEAGYSTPLASRLDDLGNALGNIGERVSRILNRLEV